MSLPPPRIADLALDRAGVVAAGALFSIRKPTEVSWRRPSSDSLVAGRESWKLPGWSAGAHVAWTPLEGLTITPEGFLEGRGSEWVGDGAFTLGMHTEAGWVAWQVEGRAGVSWVRSTVRWRTRIEELSGDSSWIGEPQERARSDLAPWAQCGIQLQSVFPRQPFQIWSLGRWGGRDPYVLLDEDNAEILPSMVMDFQFGGGVHRKLGGRNTLTLGVLRTILAPAGLESADATTEFVVQWDVVLRKGR